MGPPRPLPHKEETIQGRKTSRSGRSYRQPTPDEIGLGIDHLDERNSSSPSQAAPTPRALNRLLDTLDHSNRWSTAVQPDISCDSDVYRYNKSPMFGSMFNPPWPANTHAADPCDLQPGELNEGIMSAPLAPPQDKAGSTPAKKDTNEKAVRAALAIGTSNTNGKEKEAQSLVAPPLDLATANLHQLASRPLPPGTPTNLDNFINDLLEENYREQATTFAQNASSRSTIRSTKSPALPPASVPRRSLSRSISQDSVDGPASPSQVLSPSGSFYTPTRTGPLSRTARELGFTARQRNYSTPQRQVRVASQSFSTPTGKVVLETYGQSPSGKGASPYTTYGHRFTRVPSTPGTPSSNKRSKSTSNSEDIIRGPLYFTNEERQGHIALVSAVEPSCKNPHANCTDCRNIQFAFYENKTMSTAIPADERQKIINNNRSLRNIKNELENLAEHGAISDEAYDTIMRSLPQESSLKGSSARANPTPSPAPVPTNSFANMKVNDEPPPPAYNTPTAGPPSLPNRGRPEIARATALYRYAEPEDCNFEVGDEISVFEKMNADWWLGKNTRTGKEGVFPVNYVQVQTNPAPLSSAYGNEKASAYGNEKSNGYPGASQPQQQGPPAPGPSNPYNSSVPPMAVAEQPTDGKSGKGGEMGKKFGKKLGNAAIFGAGATIGGNIVNSIF